MTGRCVIIAGSPDASVGFIRSFADTGDYIICADRGYDHARAAEIKPDLIVGDFDSVREALPSDCELVQLSPDKDDTDTLHCISIGLEKGYMRFSILGAVGGRLDHSFANLCALQYIYEYGAKGELVSENETITFLDTGDHAFDNCFGMTFSVFPFGCKSVGLSYKGAKYPLNHGTLENGFPMGVSNVFTSDHAIITVHDGAAIIIINNCLSAL